MADHVPWVIHRDRNRQGNGRQHDRLTSPWKQGAAHRTTDLVAIVCRRGLVPSRWYNVALGLALMCPCFFVVSSEATRDVLANSQTSHVDMVWASDEAHQRIQKRSMDTTSVEMSYQSEITSNIACNVTFDPTEVSLDENDIKEVNFTANCSITTPSMVSQNSQDGAIFDVQVSFRVLDDTIATVQEPRQFNYSLSRDHRDTYHTNGDQATEDTGPSYDNSDPTNTRTNTSDTENYSIYGAFSVKGIQFGRTRVQTTLTFVNSSGSVTHEGVTDHDLVVKKGDNVISLIYLIIVGVMIVIYNFGFGCKVKVELIIAIVKRPVAPVIGLCCQFLIMSPLSFGVAKLLNLSNEAGMGLLAIGSAPGGGGSNVFAFLLKGDLELSITMTFLSTIASLGMTPLWIWALGRFFMGEDAQVKIPVANVFSSLAIVTIPVILGILVNKFKPRVAKKIAWCLKPATGVIGAVFISLGVYVYYSALVRVSWETLVACIVVSFCGYTLGATVGKIFRQPRPRWLTISLETGFQNLALALMIIGTSLEPPESDLAGVVPVCYTFLSAAMPATVFIIKMIVQICRGEKPWKASESEDITTPDMPSDQNSPARNHELQDVPESCTAIKISRISANSSETREKNGDIKGAMDHGKENGSVDISPTRSYDNEVFEHV